MLNSAVLNPVSSPSQLFPPTKMKYILQRKFAFPFELFLFNSVFGFAESTCVQENSN